MPANEQALAKLEAWLRYYQDLGLGPFYSSRTISAIVPRPAAAAVETALASESELSVACLAALEVSLPRSAAPTLPSRKGGVALASPAASRPGPAPPVPVEPALPAIGAPTLFEPVLRIEGDTLERTRGDLGDCTRCKLHKSRSRIVFGDGNPHAELVFVGEGPGEEEDRQGLPFVGRAGKLLTQMIEAMGLRREDVYIGNIVKCRPPANRTPEKDEVAACFPFLERQLAVIGPKVIVCLGNVAAQAMLATTEPMARLRGKWFDWRGAKLLPTYHPAYLLRNPNAKPIVWEDLQKVMAAMGLKPPKRLKKT